MFASLLAVALATQPLPPPARASGGPELAAACEGRDGWSDPAPPARIIGNTYYVGTCGISAILIARPGGHVLIDGATAQAAPGILANIRRLGFDPRDIRYILTSHEHVDHVGGLAALRQATGARVVARAEARAVLESGRTAPDDPQAGAIPDFAGVPVDELIGDGGSIRVGGVEITAYATPAHTNGSTSWTWRACNSRRVCPTIVYADSLTAVSADGYLFSDHPRLVARFRETLERVARLDCDILITPHPGASNLFGRLAGRAPLVNRAGCRDYAAAARQRLDDRLAREAGR
jgi:metallo-beta-lactamase class B